VKLSDLEDADNVVTKDHLDRFETRMIERFNGIDARFNILDAKVNGVEAKVDGNHNKLDARIDRLSAKIDRVGRTIWIPAVAAIAQLLLLLFHKKLGL
jgi:hypothetical protein